MSAAFRFERLCVDPGGTQARRARLYTAHGCIDTPVFMPVGTQGTVKGLSPLQLEVLNAEIILGNTYHLYLRPGTEVISLLGGLHSMMAWNRPILTDSGGFQVFSLRDRSTITENGVTFQSHIDGSEHLFTPEKAVEIQEVLGSDIMMAFDECPPSEADTRRMRSAMERTSRWAKRCIDARTREDSALFGIVQGGFDQSLREESARSLCDLPFDGYALGGLSVGEARPLTHATIAVATPHLPADKPRYLMGVGTPEDLLVSVGLGVDMFDCVLPTRNARNGRIMGPTGDFNLRNAQFRRDAKPLVDGCTCYTCSHFTRAYLRHLMVAQEILYSTLATIHNLHYLLDLMACARRRIEEGDFGAWRDEVLSKRAKPATE
jgi:queuine tRNA-ribosyltransferase